MNIYEWEGVNPVDNSLSFGYYKARHIKEVYDYLNTAYDYHSILVKCALRNI